MDEHIPAELTPLFGDLATLCESFKLDICRRVIRDVNISLSRVNRNLYVASASAYRVMGSRRVNLSEPGCIGRYIGGKKVFPAVTIKPAIAGAPKQFIVAGSAACSSSARAELHLVIAISGIYRCKTTASLYEVVTVSGFDASVDPDIVIDFYKIAVLACSDVDGTSIRVWKMQRMRSAVYIRDQVVISVFSDPDVSPFIGDTNIDDRAV